MSADPDSVTPPEGQLSFSGIPEAQFVEDVDSHMAGEDNAEHKLKVRAVATIWYNYPSLWYDII